MQIAIGLGIEQLYYLRQDQGERSEHWRRLRDWLFCPSVPHFVCVHDE